MHEEYDEWQAILDELYPELVEEPNEAVETFSEELIKKFKIDPVFITIGLSIEEGISVQSDGENDALMVALLSALFKGDLDTNILDVVPKLKPLFPSWGDETPMIYPNSTLWENIDEDE